MEDKLYCNKCGALMEFACEEGGQFELPSKTYVCKKCKTGKFVKGVEEVEEIISQM